mmetsp:Transcript_15087/g.32428  ORF Transcript_15087/g.32428 Transcript_15087/m.32428 type:complete len:440 (-) Transcript_15087:285-1604(-)|eukprot:CAMPEP_0118935172 /NCGR_PEP_ID=MMETSP1169-20130426/15064_1 /TAXON_ID=36882 /ORGANISM="Pyramimonas obovata, Strain CCMP722" /LENGTH=439 /DNA_ID=CAMNT_0006878165 /DNA_START=289 /DNA_END=1608 /DNA_ORIENTATION=+
MGLQAGSGVTTRAAAAAAAAAAAGLGQMELEALHADGRKLSQSGVRGGSGAQAQMKRSKEAWAEELAAGESKREKRSALADISNTRGDEAAAAGKLKETKTGPTTRGSRQSSMSSAMQRPLSNTEASLVLERRRSQLFTQRQIPLAFGYSKPTPTVKNVDEPYSDDPLMCTQYVMDIYSFLRTSEYKHRPNTQYMEQLQRDINHTMRSILIDWLVEVAEEYKLIPDTLFLAVTLIDRFLSSYACDRVMLQLVGVTCMLIAAKYEEIYAPQVDDFCYITDNSYQHDQVLDMERKILKTLGFDLVTPTTKTFVRRYLRAADSLPNDKVDCLASFLAELTLLEYSFLKYRPSMIAASTIFLSQFILDRPCWTPTLAHYSDYKAMDLKECVKDLHAVFVKPPTDSTPAIRAKYRKPIFKEVSNLTAMDEIPDSLFDDLTKTQC